MEKIQDPTAGMMMILYKKLGTLLHVSSKQSKRLFLRRIRKGLFLCIPLSRWTDAVETSWWLEEGYHHSMS
eukprot:8858848-Ditylum_brightwellii.AAC.1